MTTHISTIHVDVEPEVAFERVVDLMMKPSGRTRFRAARGAP